MNGIVPPSPNVRAGWPKAACDASSSAAASHGANGGAFQPGADVGVSKRTVAPVRRIGEQRALDGGQGGLVVARRRQAEAQLRASSTGAARCRPGSSAACRRRRCSSASGATSGRASCSVGSSIIGRVAAGERELVGRRERRARPRSSAALGQAVGGDLDVQLGQQHRTRSRCPRAGRGAGGSAGSSTARRRSPAPEWAPAVSTSTRQLAGGQPAQRRRDPQPFVVEAAGVEADHQLGRADAGRRAPRRGPAGRGCRSPRWPRSARAGGRGRCPAAWAASIASSEANAA